MGFKCFIDSPSQHVLNVTALFQLPKFSGIDSGTEMVLHRKEMGAASVTCLFVSPRKNQGTKSDTSGNTQEGCQ